MRDKVLELLKDKKMKAHEKFNEALMYYRRHKFSNPSSVRMYNQVGVSPEMLKNLLYDLQKLYGISDVEKRSKASPDKKEVKEDPAHEVILLGGLPEDLAKQLLDLNIPEANYHKELKPLAFGLSEFLEVELENQKSETLEKFLMSQKISLLDKTSDEETFENPFNEAPQDAKEGLKLREEFPFLNEKDCPDKLKILVADKLTAFKNVVEAREDLLKNKDGQELSPAEVAEKCKSAVVDLKLNEDIYKELDYYNQHKELLMEHPIFSEERQQREIDEMSDNDAHQKLRNLKTYISKEKRNLENSKEEDARKVIEDKILDHEKNIHLIEKKLGLDAKE